ncbi:outer envelope pore protein 24B, chloroplastic [Beta vulgaris subsp. vulgaris]|uniref:outer envelope pore protein 24B, chloroplastic n=1 Tax=Beta vulgaris subsp. vulgaris TaxID=3555 RepID=UPI00203733DD|nr:outer envelope pore protein 24B, chloroplastic [Beta vulgaris subsp. vulgaris]
MKASLKGKYEYDTQKTATSATSTLAIPAGDFKLRASMTDATFVKGPSLNGLALSLEKPGFFIVDYNVPKKDFRFQFMNSVRVLEKPLKLTYIHSVNDNRTVLDGTLVLDSSNKVSVNHMLGSRNGKLKYNYVHGGGTTFEPCYDLGKNCWDFALSRRVYGDDILKASYQSSNRILGVDWTRNSKSNGCFKISAIFNLAEEVKMPKLMAESTWNFEM